MALKNLLNKQKIRIDNHKRGTRLPNSWDDTEYDVHIDKETQYKIDGRKRKVVIKVPLNSNRPVICKTGKGEIDIPKKLMKEIQEAFSNNKIRRAFINDLINTLKNYPSIMSSEKKARQAIQKLSEHFGLELTGKVIKTYIEDYLNSISQNFKDETDRLYYIKFDLDGIEAGEVTQWTRSSVYQRKGM